MKSRVFIFNLFVDCQQIRYYDIDMNKQGKYFSITISLSTKFFFTTFIIFWMGGGYLLIFPF